jgi:hypothetical protein
MLRGVLLAIKLVILLGLIPLAVDYMITLSAFKYSLKQSTSDMLRRSLFITIKIP